MSGLHAWTLQRLTAICMLVFCVVVLLGFTVRRPHSFTEWHAWVASPLILLATELFFVALSLHTWVGLRDVIMDYVRPLALRICLFSLFAIEGVAIVLWVFLILLGTQG